MIKPKKTNLQYLYCFDDSDPTFFPEEDVSNDVIWKEPKDFTDTLPPTPKFYTPKNIYRYISSQQWLRYVNIVSRQIPILWLSNHWRRFRWQYYTPFFNRSLLVHKKSLKDNMWRYDRKIRACCLCHGRKYNRASWWFTGQQAAKKNQRKVIPTTPLSKKLIVAFLHIAINHLFIDSKAVSRNSVYGDFDFLHVIALYQS